MLTSGIDHDVLSSAVADGWFWCPKCSTLKPVGDFPKDRSRKHGLATKCKQCDRARSAAYFAANRDVVLMRNRPRARQSYATARTKAIDIYGGCCVMCGSTEQLEFDHVNGDGGQHREWESGVLMVRRIARTGAPIPEYELRLLCFHCHRGAGTAVA